MTQSAEPTHGQHLIRSPQQLLAGLVLMAIGLAAFWALGDLPIGDVNRMGPAMVPKAMAIVLAIGGVLLAVRGFSGGGSSLAGFDLRGPVLISLGLVLFAVTVRPYGLAVATPLALFFSGMAARPVRWLQLVLFVVVMTVLCVGLLVLVLDLPIPVLILPGTDIEIRPLDV